MEANEQIPDSCESFSTKSREEPTCYHSQVLLAAVAVLLLVFVCCSSLICRNRDEKQEIH